MVIVDLFQQRDAVAAKLREMPAANIIPWLQSCGELIQIEMSIPAPPSYRFRSNTGIESVFVIRDDKMTFVGDNTTLASVLIR